MEAIVFWALAIWGFFFVRKKIRAWRFRQVVREYEAKWQLLSNSEQVEFLYAFHGFSYKDQLNDAEVASNEKVSPDIEIAQTLYTNDLYEKAHELRSSCPKYEEMQRYDLMKVFYKKIYSYWEPMRITGDYDMTWMKVELGHIFTNRSELAAMINGR